MVGRSQSRPKRARDIIISTPAPAIDTATLARHTGHDRALQRTLLGLFFEQAMAVLHRLDEAAEHPAALADALHLIKGSARAIGATRSSAAAEAAEAAMPPDGRTDAALAASVADLRLALAEACDHAARLLHTA